MNWRKWIRIIHRDLGYICFGLTILYAISGIAVNHIADWNPSYSIARESTSINFPDAPGKTEDLTRYILTQLGETGEVKNVHRPSPDILQIFVTGNNITATLSSGKIIQEKIKKRPLIHQFNFLHLNHPKKMWTWIADLYAIALLFLGSTGIFMIRGRNGIFGRGAWLVSAGIVIPILFLLLYG